MRYSLNWLLEFVEIPDVETLLRRLPLVGLEVASAEKTRPSFEKVVAAEIRAVRKHPNADRLSLCTVFDGKKEREVVCGAPNVRPGLRGAFAAPGSRLGETEVRTAHIRGAASEGMLCSAKELGLGEDHTGILELTPDGKDGGVRAGSDLAKFLELEDWILDLEVPPHRGDLLGHWGLARELGYLFGWKIRPPKTSSPPAQEGRAAGGSIPLRIEDPAGCPRYVAGIARVEVRPSPLRVAARLGRLGLRPIHNVVDATNYVLLEMGHPTHAFDRQKLEGGGVVVRRAKEGESLLCLDGKSRALDGECLVISDNRRPCALAGIIGGEESGVTVSTEEVYLEAAWFDPGLVRRMSRRLAVSTESSYRFERNLDPEGPRLAMRRLISLLSEWAGARYSGGREVSVAAGRLFRPRKISFRPSEIRVFLLGPEGKAAAFSDQKMAPGLRRLDPKAKLRGNTWTIQVPSHRRDIAGPEDIAEEVARLAGYEEIPEAGGAEISLRSSGFSTADKIRSRTRELLLGMGFSEICAIPLISEEEADILGAGGPLLKNPVSREMRVLAGRLWPGLLRAAARNRDRGQEAVRLFEIGKEITFATSSPHPQDERSAFAARYVAEAGAQTLREEWVASAILWGRNASWEKAKGCAETALHRLRVPAQWERWENPDRPFRKGGAGRALSEEGGAVLAEVGEADPEALGRLDLPAPSWLLRLRLEEIARRQAPERYAGLPKFPSAWRDLSFAVPWEQTAGACLREIRAAAGEIGASLESVRVVAVFSGPPVPEGSRSLTFRLVFRHPERTLTEEEVNRAVAAVAERMKRLGFSQR